MDDAPAVLILGIGNLLWADEGFGVRAVEALHAHYAFSGNVTVMDGGTQGAYLVQHVRDADILIVFDAVDYGLAPGTLKLVHGEEVPKFLGVKKVSLHQTGFQEVLAMADMLGDLPRELFLIGVQPAELDDFGGSLRTVVKAQIMPAINAALDYLRGLGLEPKLRPTPLPEEETIACEVMRLQNYETERPNRDDAYRYGDARLVSDANWHGPSDHDKEIEQILSNVEGNANECA